MTAEVALTLVTNPSFIHDRGEEFRAEIPRSRWPELYRAGCIARLGFALLNGSDGPYAGLGP